MKISDPIPHDPERWDFDTWSELELRRRIKRLRKIYGLADLELKEKILAADYQACKEDPVYFINQYVYITNPKGEEKVRDIPLVLFPKQVELSEKIYESLRDKHPLLVNKGRELGVTWEFICIVLHEWRFTSGFSAKLGSRKESLVDDNTVDSLFGKLRYILKKLPKHLREANTRDNQLKILNNRNGSEIIGEATNPGFGRGGRKTCILFDEFAHVPAAIAANCWSAVDTVSETIWLPSTPNGKANKFFQLYSSFPTEYIFRMSWRDNPYRDERWKEERLKKQSVEEFEQEHEASFSAIRTGKIFSATMDALIYSEDDVEWSNIKNEARATWSHMGGWDFGSGPSLTCCLFALLTWRGNDPFPDIYVDDELTWKSAAVGMVGHEAKRRIVNYGSHFKFHVGDPAGENRESEQTSWITNLQMMGIPIQGLPQEFNTREGIDNAIKLIQWMIDSGKIKINSRCRLLVEAIQSWRYDIPDGVPAEMVSKTWIAPRKDVYSHPMNALMYLVRAALMYMKREKTVDQGSMRAALGKVNSNSLSSVLSRARQA